MTCDAVKNLGNDSFDAVLGAITRPVVAPGFAAEVIVNPAVCGNQTRSRSPAFTIPSGCDNDATPCPPRPVEQFQVNLVFTPPVGDSHVVVLREDCTTLDTIGCSVPDERILCLGRQDTSPPRFDVRVRSLPFGSERRLEFVTPDTTTLTGSGFPLAGPATVAVSLASDPIPCGLATTECKGFTGPLVSCADTLFKRDSTCTTDSSRIEPSAPNLTVLPPPSLFVDLCAAEADASGQCRALSSSSSTAPLIPFTQNKAGDILGMVDMRDVLIRTADGESFPRRTRGALALKGTGAPLPIKNALHIESRAPTYARITPVFEPVLDPLRPGEFFGTTDAAFHLGVGKAHSCANDPSVPCSVDSVCEELPCPGGGDSCDKSCSVVNYPQFCATGSEPFCTLGGAGPILGECPFGADGLVRCRLNGSVSLDTLASAGLTDQVVPAPVNECIGQTLAVQTERNFDSDQRDVIMTLFDRLFGFELRSIGSGGAEGRALTRVISRQPFSFTTHEFEDNVVAFLEPEQGECDSSAPLGCDRDGSGSASGNLLKAFALNPAGSATVTDLLAAPNQVIGTDVVAPDVDGLGLGVQTSQGFAIAAEPDLNVNLSALAVSDGLVFFRTRPDAPRALSLASAQSADASLSPEGRFLAFTAQADLSPQDKNRLRDVYLKNLETGAAILASSKIRDSCLDRERAAEGPSGEGVVSANGEIVAFSSDAAKLLDRPKGPPQDTNGVTDVFGFGRSTCNVQRYSVRSDGGQANGRSFAPSISADGTLVVFVSQATNLDPADTSPDPDVYLHDRTTRQTTLVSGGSAAAGAISADGSAIAFQSDEGPAAGDDILVDDGSAGLILASAPTDGTSANGGSFNPFISASGRFVVYESDATNLDDSGPSGQRNVFVHDLVTGQTRRAGVSGAPRECRDPALPEPLPLPDGPLSQPRITEDGRFLFYASTATNLVPDDGNPTQDVFVEDLRTGAILRLSQKPATGAPGSLASGAPTSSSDGSVVAFESLDRNLAGGVSGAPSVLVSRGGLGGSAGEAVLGVLDTRTPSPTLYVLDARAEFVKVANGAAAFVAPGENVRLLRSSCGGVVGGGLCDESCAADCRLVVEDLLRPGVSEVGALSLSASHVCALVDEPGGPRPACHEIGTSPALSLDDVAGPGVTADEIQVFGSNAAFTRPQPDGSRLLYEVDLSQAAPVAQAVQPVEDFVLGDVACFRTAETVTGDQNGDGDTGEKIMFVDDPIDAIAPVSCRFSASRCELAPCDPRVPYVSNERTCKFVTDEELRGDCLAANRDLNLDGECTELMRRCTLGEENSDVVLGSITAVDLDNQTSNPLTAVEGQGDLTRGPACVRPEAPLVPGTLCPCDPPEVCSDTLVPPVLFTLNCADPDGDGVCDRDDFCDTRSNPDPVDFDMDGVPDECDGLLCGNGKLEEGEICDFSVDPASCTALCTPEPPAIDVSEQSVNPTKQGVLPSVLLSTAIINLDVFERDGQPPRMVDAGSLRMAAVVGGVCPGMACVGGASAGAGCSENADCPGGICGGTGKVCVAAGSLDGTTCADDSDCGSGTCGGTTEAHELTGDAAYAGHLTSDRNGDTFPDLTLHFGVLGSGITGTTEEVCIKGRYSVSIDPSQPEATQTFVTKDVVNVN